MKCYRCKNEDTYRVLLHGALVEKCPKCDGIFLDSTEFEKMSLDEEPNMEDVWLEEQAEVYKETYAKKLKHRLNLCPKCNGPMLPHKINKEKRGEFVIDICKDCGGSHYDKGELESHLESIKPMKFFKMIHILFIEIIDVMK